jgi:uncharacterized protein (DUF1697 family)
VSERLRQIALLRAINLGSRNRIAMADLRRIAGSLGYEDVATYVQSGNLVLSSAASPAEVEARLSKAIAAELGLDVPVVVRTRDELAAVIERDPLGHWQTDPKRYQVAFLEGEPDPAAVAAAHAAAAEYAPEEFMISGREIYRWHPRGQQAWKADKLLSAKKLGVRATARNWTTVTALLELADSA